MADVFISYARPDQAKIERLAAALENAGYSVWWDRHIKGGTQYGKHIEQAITDAKAVIVAWSKDAVESEWVRDEATFARDANKFVPILLDATLPPLGYRQRQSIDLSHGTSESALAELHASLDALTGSEHEAIGHLKSPRLAHDAKKIVFVAIPILLLAAFAGWIIMRGGGQEIPKTAEQVDDRKRVAILPFLAQSTNDDDQYFADGVTEEILNRLDSLPELRVLPRTTVFAFKDSKEPIESLSSKLGVDYLVEGSLRRGGEEIRVSARLIRSRDSETLWSNTYDGTASEILKFQSDIAEKVAASLDIVLDKNKLEQMRNVGVDDPEAFAKFAKASDLYVRGHFELPNLEMLYQSSLLFDQAFAEAPRLWEAMVKASDVYAHIILNKAAGISHPELPPTLVRNAKSEMQYRLMKARRAAPGKQDRLAIDLYAQGFTDDWRQIPAMAKEYYSNHRGCYAANWAGFLVKSLGETENIANAYLRMEDCRVGDRLFLIFAVDFLIQSRRLEEARALVERARMRGLVASNELDAIEANIEIAAGNLDRAIRLASSSDDFIPEFFARALKKDQTLIEDIDRRLNDEGMAPWLEITFLAITGQRNRVNQLAAVIDARQGGSTTLQESVDNCGCGAPFDIENTPNYSAVLKRSGISWPFAPRTKFPMKTW